MDTFDVHLQLPVLEPPLYVLRRGQTAWNVEAPATGCRTRLSPSSVASRPVPWGAVWQDDPRLTGHGSGAWGGRTWPEIERDCPGAYADWKRDSHKAGPPGGEAHRDLERRSASVLAEIAASRTCTVVVGHGVNGAVLRGLALGLRSPAVLALAKSRTAFFRLQAGHEERIEAM
jgi:broad specificity phosphatase PhoE